MGIFLGKGQVISPNILLVYKISPYSQYLIVSLNFLNKKKYFQPVFQLDKLSLPNIQPNIKVGHLFLVKDYIIGPQVQDVKRDTILALSIKGNVQLQNIGNQLTNLTTIAFYQNRLFQLSSFYIQKFSSINYTGSIYKSKAIYFSINKGSNINSISILRYYIQNYKVFSIYQPT